MKRILAIILSVSILIVGMSNFTFAQGVSSVDKYYAVDYCKTQSTICGSSPEQFTYLMDFVREMTNSIKTIGTASPYLGAYVSPNRFKWTSFSPPQQTLANKFVTNLSKKATFSIATIAILASPVNLAGLKDMFWWIALLTKDYVFLRDSKLVEKTESIVTDKQYQLGLWGWWAQIVTAQNQEIMRGIIKKYEEKWLLQTSESRISDSVTYSQITALMLQILSTAKWYLYFGTRTRTFWSSDKTKWLHVGLGIDAWIAIQTDYNCVKWSEHICSAEHMKIGKTFAQAFSSLFGKNSKGATALKTIKDASNRLSQLFLPSQEQSDQFIARQQSLLVSMYGTKEVSMSKWLKGLLIDPFKKTWTDIKQSASDVVNDAKSYRTIPQDLKTTVQNIPPPSYLTEDPLLADVVTKSVDSYIADVLASQAVDLDIVSMSELKDFSSSWSQGVTPAFAVLSRQIASIRNDLIGSKEKDNTIIKSLWTACHDQCGRWWSCR